ncbi:hypothetical protein EPUL_003495, partial [Erysiphe pulchra]
MPEAIFPTCSAGLAPKLDRHQTLWFNCLECAPSLPYTPSAESSLDERRALAKEFPLANSEEKRIIAARKYDLKPTALSSFLDLTHLKAVAPAIDYSPTPSIKLSYIPPPVVSANNDGPVGNENIEDFIDPQIIDIEMEMATNSRATENTNLDFNLNNPAINKDLKFCTQCKRNRTSNLFKGRVQTFQATTNVESHLPSIDVDSGMKYCTMCKKNCPSNLFTNNTENTPYTTCSDCRSLERSRRYPLIFPTASTEVNTMYPLGKLHLQILNKINHFVGQVEDIYETSDNENNNIGARENQPNFIEVVGEEAVVDDEPVITWENATHMSAREMLPENVDNIINNLSENNVDQENIDPFGSAIGSLDTELNSNDDNRPVFVGGIRGQTDEDNTNVISEENLVVDRRASTRMPYWNMPLPTRRSAPAAYFSRFDQNMPTHNLGNRTSICPSCKAIHWVQERVHSSSIVNPRFQTCCKEGQVVLDSIP